MSARSILAGLLVLGLSTSAIAQFFPFNSGPIPLCNTSTFTANVSGIGQLYPPGLPWTYSLQTLTINVTSDHPQTLQITLTSPAGTDLLLTEFNGAGGQNYTNTTFTYWPGNPSITTGAAPFSGSWTAQGGLLDVFDYENADGTWTITVVDTSCANGGTGPGGTWTPGWFDGAAGGGGFVFGFSGPPPCWGGIPSDVSYICPGGSFDLAGYYAIMGSPYNFTFYTSWGGPTVPDATMVGTGSYYIEAYDPWEGCLYSASFDVIQTTPASLGPDQVVDQCSDAGPVDLTALFTLAGGMPTWTLDGTPIGNAAVMAATDAGAYELIEENPGGCNDTAVVTLNIIVGPLLGPDQSIDICPGSSVDLDALYDTNGLPGSWSLGGFPFANPTSATDAGIYTLSVTDASGCSANANVTLAVQALGSLGPDQSVDLCSNDEFDLTLLYVTAGLSTEWTLAGDPVPDPSAVSDGGNYRLVASNGTGCSDTAFVAVNSLASPELGPDATASICADEMMDLGSVFAISGLSASWTYSGSPVADPSAVNTAGPYDLEVTNTAGCADVAALDLIVAAVPVLGPDQSLTECAGVPVDLTLLYSTGADATTWTQSGAAVDEPSAVTGSGSFMITATNAVGCSASALVTLDREVVPDLGADQSAAICAGASFDLSSVFNTAGLNSTWSLGGTAVADPSDVSDAGNYQLVAVNTAGCSDVATLALTVNTNPALGEDRSFALCPWRTIDLAVEFPAAGAGAVYSLDGEVLSDASAVHDAGTYLISVTDANGCVDEATAMVENIDCLCEADFSHDANCFQEPVQFVLEADSTVMSAQWDFEGAGSSVMVDPLVTFSTDGDMLVTLEATLSCGVVVVEYNIELQDCTNFCSVWIPSAFTPDNDTRNDAWTWQGACEPEDFSLEVFDRYGELIFASKDPMSCSWDGSYAGGPSPPGVYSYRVGYRLPYQKRKEVMGSVTLLR